MENREIAAVFEEVANLMRILQDDPKWSFKAAAYDRAKRSSRAIRSAWKILARDPDRKLTDIPGIGADLAKKIKEIRNRPVRLPPGTTGKNSPRLARPFAAPNSRTAKGAALLQASEHPHRRRFGSRRQEGRLRELPGMSEKSEENILKAIEVFRAPPAASAWTPRPRRPKCSPRGCAMSQSRGEGHSAGSLRRGRETVGDLDLLVAGRDPNKHAVHFVSFPESSIFWSKGEDKVSVKIQQRPCRWTSA